MPKYVDWTDTYKQDKAKGPIIPTKPTRTSPPEASASKRNHKELTTAKPAAKVSSRRRSVTGTDNAKYITNKEATMPAVKTSKSPAKNTAPRRRNTKAAEAVETLTLTLAKVPSGKGGFLYNDQDDHDEKLHVTSMYLSQDAIAKMFGGEAPESLTISA